METINGKLTGIFIDNAEDLIGAAVPAATKEQFINALKDAQKNMVTIGFTMLFAISLFLFLGGLLNLYAAQNNITAAGDTLFPTLALHHMPPYISIIFILAAGKQKSD